MILKYLIYGKTYCAVEHSFLDGKENFHILELIYKKKSFEILSSRTFQSFSEVTNTLKKEQHVFVVINNDKVLSKKVDGVHEVNEAFLLAFPNIKSADFLIDVLPQKGVSYVSICRREVIEDVFSNYTQNNINVVGLSLGNNIIGSLLRYLSISNIKSSNATISFENSLVTGVAKREEHRSIDYTINDLDISSNHILTLSAILSYFEENLSVDNNFVTRVLNLKNNFKRKRIFTNSIKFGLSSIFMLLLVNFLFYSHYQDELISLTANQRIGNNYKNDFQYINNEIAKKRNLVSNITSNTTGKVSFYLDEIAKSIPNSILLSQIYFQPIQHKIKPLKEIKVNRGVITVSGNVRINNDFSNWVGQLEKLKWVQKASVTNYGVDSKSNTIFDITITLN